MTRRRDPYSYTTVRLPESDLAELVFDFASPLLAKLGASPSIVEERYALELAVNFWNANVLASKHWEFPRVKELNALKKRLRGREASQDDAATFDLLSERWRAHWLDPRLVDSWTYDTDASGARRLTCKVGLPDRVYAEVPPPVDKRIAIAGKFLDEVRIRQDASGRAYVSFPYSRHSGTVAEDGTATVRTMLPSALQLFAEGLLPSVNSASVDVVVGGRALGPMLLAEVHYAGMGADAATLIFKPASNTHDEGRNA